ncbi:MAG: hypothetical protein GY753_00930 [Gammaproteobacteria bacterium]|nr:hypothetical protein [Gammaproteobacteria bacterium]
MKSAIHLIAALTLTALANTPGRAAGTPAREYMAPLHDAKWLASEEDGQCQLHHLIPGIGETMLTQGYREPLSFELHVTQEINLGAQCRVEIGPPPWRHNIPTQNLGTIKLVPDAKHVMAKGSAAQKIYQALEAGMMTSFTCQRQKPTPSNIRVVISPVRYRMALPDFQKCTANLSGKKIVASSKATGTGSKKKKQKKK